MHHLFSLVTSFAILCVGLILTRSAAHGVS
jgi:hypothetical protein